MKLNFKLYTTLTLLLIGVSIIAGCKKYDNPPPVFEEIKDLSTAQRKVLVITIDGLPGAELQKSLPANMAMMKRMQSIPLILWQHLLALQDGCRC